MKVLCIKERWSINPNVGTDNPPMPSYLEICTVLEEDRSYGILQYKLVGYPSDILYTAKGFVPCSDIDERARLEAWREEQLTQEDKMLQALSEHMPAIEMSQEAFDRVWKGVEKSLA